MVSGDLEATRRLDGGCMMQTVNEHSALMPPVLLPRKGSRRSLIAYATRLAEVSQDIFAPAKQFW